MRPVERGKSPLAQDFSDYRDAFLYLVSRLGPYCSYCERRIATLLAVEHILPKDIYPSLEGSWANFLLGCVNCNSTKGAKEFDISKVFLPDRDNTAIAFEYLQNGKVVPAARLSPTERKIAEETLSLTGLDRKVSEAIDENGRVVAIDRQSQRMEAWGLALVSKMDLQNEDSPALRRQIVRTAQETGFFSIWLAAFEDDPEMSRLFIRGFTDAKGQYFGFAGTAQDCFDKTGNPVSPRPANGLPAAGKI